MRTAASIYLYEGNERFFGEGPCRLLHGIEECGSLRGAAMKMGLSYNKALLLMKRAEAALGFALTDRVIGGKGGGGSKLTPEAIAFLKKYEAFRDACLEANQRLYQEYFGNIPKGDAL